jgi:hypothetical protein
MNNKDNLPPTRKKKGGFHTTKTREKRLSVPTATSKTSQKKENPSPIIEKKNL